MNNNHNNNNTNTNNTDNTDNALYNAIETCVVSSIPVTKVERKKSSKRVAFISMLIVVCLLIFCELVSSIMKNVIDTNIDYDFVNQLKQYIGNNSTI